MEITPQTKLVQDKELFASELDSEIVLMSMKSEKYFGMGNLEKEIWHQFADSASVEEICPRLVEDTMSIWKLVPLMSSNSSSDSTIGSCLRRWKSRWVRFQSLPTVDQDRILEALVHLAAARATVVLLPLKWVCLLYTSPSPRDED